MPCKQNRRDAEVGRRGLLLSHIANAPRLLILYNDHT